MRIPEKLFLKEVGRNIDTVIKADDHTNIAQEVEEYVITKEISNKLGDFFEFYNEKGSVNGAWISGFFGSGKSHLLKILNYVLENKAYDGKHVGEVFAEKVTDDFKLKGDILKSIRDFRSESILFNIDQQAQITSKSDPNAILKVFYKVFYDHQGFYGFQPHVAAFEESLYRDDKYEAFKQSFERLYGTPWVEARMDYIKPTISRSIAKACGEVYNDNPENYTNYLLKWQRELKQSIEDFSLKVNNYINTKGSNFRLNFFVDEVGQFIAGNTKLMLNLQTIAETLFTKCNGNSWVIVTSQEDLDSIVGDDIQIQSDDFSKIQGRFKARLPLTSSNVDEVIEKRLLDKTNEASVLLKNFYEQEKENIRTRFTLSDGGMQFKGYRDKDDFARKYPFLPYQFDLFQQCMKTLSRHNVFVGRHQSVGERSMLGVFQEVLKGMELDAPYRLVSFDQLFDGIIGTIRSEAINSISLAKNNLRENPMALRVLTVLFMIKYYENFKSTFHNIVVLLLDHLKTDMAAHNKAVEEALNLLEQQSYIRVSGDEYEYLTDDEKDIEEEIKNTEIDESQITRLINELAFDHIINNGNKIRYASNKQEFEFTRKVDGIMFLREKELTIEIITPAYSNYDHIAHYQANTLGDITLMMVQLPNERRLLIEAEFYLKTEKFLKQKTGNALKPSVNRILADKGEQNRLRKSQLQIMLNDQLARATIYINGTVNRSSGSSDGRTRLIETSQDLITLAYSKLQLLENATLDESQLKLIMTDAHPALFKENPDDITPPEKEILNFLERRSEYHERTSLTDLKDHFSKRPYGWSVMAIWCITARLFKRGKVEARVSASSLDDKSMLDAFNNNRMWDRALIEPQIIFSSSEITLVKQVYHDAFNETNPYSEGKDVANLFKQKAQEEARKINELLSESSRYPFLKKLEPLTKLLHNLSEMDYAKLIRSMKEHEDPLLDMKEYLYDPIMQFWNSGQRNIYNRAAAFLRTHEANFHHLDAPEKIILEQALQNNAPYKGNTMKEAKEAMDRLVDKIDRAIEEERSLLISSAEEKTAQLKTSYEYKEVPDPVQVNAVKQFEQIIEKAKGQAYIGNLKADRSQLNEIYTHQLNYLAANKPKSLEGVNEPEQPTVRYTSIQQVEKEVTLSKTRLENMNDADQYLAELRKVIEEKLKNNYKITLK